MTTVMTSLPLAPVFQCLFTFALVSISRWLAEICRREATWELKVEIEFQRRNCKLSFFFPSRRASRRLSPPWHLDLSWIWVSVTILIKSVAKGFTSVKSFASKVKKDIGECGISTWERHRGNAPQRTQRPSISSLTLVWSQSAHTVSMTNHQTNSLNNRETKQLQNTSFWGYSDLFFRAVCGLTGKKSYSCIQLAQNS